jgi:serine/threonine-protein kinase HipA
VIVDPEPVKNIKLDANAPERFAALASRASLSGIQPKLLVIKHGRGYRPACAGEISTHLAKHPSGQLPSIIEIEWLSTEAARALLPGEPVVDLEIVPLGKVVPQVLMIRCFDRTPSGRKLHFEEFNQLFGHPSDDKYDGSYEQMAEFIRPTPSCIPVEAERLFQRRGHVTFS